MVGTRTRISEELKNRVEEWVMPRIADLIGRHLPDLQKAGKELTACCPFHDDSSPSWFINPRTGLWRCFGCGKTGNLFGFFMELGQHSYPDVVISLAEEAGIPLPTDERIGNLPYPEPKQPPAKEKIDISGTEDSGEEGFAHTLRDRPDCTKDESYVKYACDRLLYEDSPDAEKAREWLSSRGYSREMMRYYRMGLTTRKVGKKGEEKKYPSVTIPIPVTGREGRYHAKKRVVPWLTEENGRPSNLGKWSQPGLEPTIYFTYNPPGATETILCEGEMDAQRLGWVARSLKVLVAIASATNGAETVPSKEELARCPGYIVTVLYDRDKAGEDGAQKVARAIGDRARIARLPMPENCPIDKWDVSNALDAGYTWEDLRNAELVPLQPEEPARKATQTSTAKPASSTAKEEFFAKLKDDWRKSKVFTPDFVDGSEHVSVPALIPGEFRCLKAGMGSGKTHNFIEKNKPLVNPTRQMIALGYRNSLNENICGRSGIMHIQEDGSVEMLGVTRDDGSIKRVGKSGGIALCVNSILSLEPEAFNGKIVLIDEVMSVIDHWLLSSTISENSRNAVIDRIVDALRRCDRVACLDGNLTDQAVEYLKKIVPNKQFTKYENTYKRPLPEVEFLLGSVKRVENKSGEIEEILRKNDRSAFLRMILDAANEDLSEHEELGETALADLVAKKCPIVIGADSQKLIKAFHLQILKPLGITTLRIDSETVCKEDIKNCLRDMNGAIASLKPQVVLYSPTAESGMDISIKNYFKAHFCFFFGVLPVDNSMQMLGRVRDPSVPKFIWTRPWTPSDPHSQQNSSMEESLMRSIEKRVIQRGHRLLDGVDDREALAKEVSQMILDAHTPHYYEALRIQALRNYEKANFRECLLERLEAVGYPVNATTRPRDEAASKFVSAAVKRQGWENAEAKFNAPDIDEEEAAELEASFLKPEDRDKLWKFKIKEQFPGLYTTIHWSLKTVHWLSEEDKLMRKKLELLWHLQNPDRSRLVETKKLSDEIRYKNVFLANSKHRESLAWALHEIGLMWFLQPGRTWNSGTPEVIDLCNRAKIDEIETALGKRQGKLTNVQFVGRLLEMVGWSQVGDRAGEGNRERNYRLRHDPEIDPIREALLTCIETRWQTYFSKLEPIVWPNTQASPADPSKIVLRKSEKIEDSSASTQSEIPAVIQAEPTFQPQPLDSLYPESQTPYRGVDSSPSIDKGLFAGTQAQGAFQPSTWLLDSYIKIEGAGGRTPKPEKDELTLALDGCWSADEFVIAATTKVKQLTLEERHAALELAISKASTDVKECLEDWYLCSRDRIAALWADDLVIQNSSPELSQPVSQSVLHSSENSSLPPQNTPSGESLAESQSQPSTWLSSSYIDIEGAGGRFSSQEISDEKEGEVAIAEGLLAPLDAPAQLPLSEYRPGQRVWAYSALREECWQIGTVESVGAKWGKRSVQVRYDSGAIKTQKIEDAAHIQTQPPQNVPLTESYTESQSQPSTWLSSSYIDIEGAGGRTPKPEEGDVMEASELVFESAGIGTQEPVELVELEADEISSLDASLGLSEGVEERMPMRILEENLWRSRSLPGFVAAVMNWAKAMSHLGDKEKAIALVALLESAPVVKVRDRLLGFWRQAQPRLMGAFG